LGSEWSAIAGTLLLTPNSSPLAAQDRPLTVVSFGGAYGPTQHKQQIISFMEQTDQPVLFESYSGGIAEIKAQVESGRVQWDVVDIETIDLERACAEGLLEEILLDVLLPADDGRAAARSEEHTS